ncbi:hypothetical protein, partial [Citrobacter braakii]|uniref:hypothetical protein n=1 Tax=Citrobacter braakii TaxID=57706 RepID=UPI0011407387
FFGEKKRTRTGSWPLLSYAPWVLQLLSEFASRLFIRTNDIPASVRVAVNKQQGQFCTITFDRVIDENKVYICR